MVDPDDTPVNIVLLACNNMIMFFLFESAVHNFFYPALIVDSSTLLDYNSKPANFTYI